MSHSTSRRNLLQSLFGGFGCLGLASVLAREEALVKLRGTYPPAADRHTTTTTAPSPDAAHSRALEAHRSRPVPGDHDDGSNR